VRGTPDFFGTRHPGPADVALLAEVSDSSLSLDSLSLDSLSLDKRWKRTIYANNAIPAYWIVNLVDRQIEVYTRLVDTAAGRDYAPGAIYKTGASVPLPSGGSDSGSDSDADAAPAAVAGGSSPGLSGPPLDPQASDASGASGVGPSAAGEPDSPLGMGERGSSAAAPVAGVVSGWSPGFSRSSLGPSAASGWSPGFSRSSLGPSGRAECAAGAWRRRPRWGTACGARAQSPFRLLGMHAGLPGPAGGRWQGVTGVYARSRL
jgi:hypothetical protein